jgi:hypothetical protein
MDVLFQAELLDEAPNTVFLCMVPERYDEMDLAMTAAVQSRFSDMETLLLKELSLHGVMPERVV